MRNRRTFFINSPSSAMDDNKCDCWVDMDYVDQTTQQQKGNIYATFTAFIYFFIFLSRLKISFCLPLFKYFSFAISLHPPPPTLYTHYNGLERKIRIFLSTTNNLCSSRILIFILKGRARRCKLNGNFSHLKSWREMGACYIYKITDFPNRNSVITDRRRRGISTRIYTLVDHRPGKFYLINVFLSRFLPLYDLS